MSLTIDQQIKSTYIVLRVGAAAIGFALPLLLWGGGKVAGITLRDSMSAYYWATPAEPCPCGENPDHSCITKGSYRRGTFGGRHSALPNAMELLPAPLFPSRILRGILLPLYRVCLRNLFAGDTCPDPRPEGARAV